MAKRTRQRLVDGLDDVAAAPVGTGRLEMIVRRPGLDEREVLESAQLDVVVGLVGDTWSRRPSRRTPDGSPHPGRQITLMNARAAALIAGSRANWPLAGDQLFVELHLGSPELPPGSRLRIGDAVIEITDQLHIGCAKFTRRFGLDATRFVTSAAARRLNMRGVNAKVVAPGTISVGDAITAERPDTFPSGPRQAAHVG